MKYLTLLTIGLLFFSSCNDDDTQTACDQEIIISPDFENITSDEFTMITAEINDQCLEVTVGAGGCDGESWTAEMYGAEVILTVFPPTIPLKLSLNNEELCDAVVQKTFSFSLSSIMESYPEFFLTIEGFEEEIEYNSGDLQN